MIELKQERCISYQEILNILEYCLNKQFLRFFSKLDLSEVLDYTVTSRVRKQMSYSLLHLYISLLDVSNCWFEMIHRCKYERFNDK